MQKNTNELVAGLQKLVKWCLTKDDILGESNKSL